MTNPHTQKAYEFVRKRILEGVFPPGRRLQTEFLAAEIGVSRTPVRDALRQLEFEGLVEIKPQIGASVRSVSLAKFREFCELRLALESCAAELATKNQLPEDWREIESAFNAMERFVSSLKDRPDFEQLGGLVQADLRFHFSILQAAHNELLKDEILRLHVLDRILSQKNALTGTELEGEFRQISADLNHIRTVLESHRRIFLAIKARQPEEARSAMHAHISETVKTSIMAIAKLERNRELDKMTRDVLHS